MLASHTQAHFFVVLWGSCQFTHQKIKLLLNTIDSLFHALILRDGTSQAQGRSSFIHSAKGIRTWVIFSNTLLTEQTGVASITSASSHLSHKNILTYSFRRVNKG